MNIFLTKNEKDFLKSLQELEQTLGLTRKSNEWIKFDTNGNLVDFHLQFQLDTMEIDLVKITNQVNNKDIDKVEIRTRYNDSMFYHHIWLDDLHQQSNNNLLINDVGAAIQNTFYYFVSPDMMYKIQYIEKSLETLFNQNKKENKIKL